jgi:voltage-gated potassium channel
VLGTLMNALLIVAATAAAVLVPLQLAVGALSPRTCGIVSWTLTVLFTIDLVAKLRPSARNLPYRTLQRKPRPTWLGADILAAIPFYALVPGLPALELFRLLKLARVGELMSEERRRVTEHWTFVRLAFFFFWTGLAVHWLSCGWYALRQGTDADANYLEALYWCVQTVTTVGYGDVPPETDAERLYAMLAMLVGVGVYGYVIGNVASLLTKIDPARAHHQENMQRLEAFMRSRGLPPALQHRIRDYNAYAWEKRLGYDETTILSGLPPGLMREVMLHLKRDVLEKVPFFRGADAELISDLAQELKPLVTTPGELVFRAGELGEEMYFITRGSVEIISPEGKGEVFATLHEGDFFGEIALLMHRPRSASARAATYCDLYGLERESFERVLARHPAFHAHIEAMTRERQERTG